MQASVLEELGPRIDEWTGAIHATLERYLRDAGSSQPVVDARVLFAMIDGVAQDYLLSRGSYPLAGVTDRMVEIATLLLEPPHPSGRHPR
jgi:hypothetical protein